MKILGIIPARKGSKRIPKKNLAYLKGKMLIEYTFEVAQKANLDKVVVSTDWPEIQALAIQSGIHCPSLRPYELSGDETGTLPVLVHELKNAEFLCGYEYDAVFCLQPTSPLRTVGDINKSIKLMQSLDCSSVVSVVPTEKPGYKIREVIKGQMVNANIDPNRSLVVEDGSVYLVSRQTLLEGSMYGEDCVPYPIPRSRYCNIDYPNDLLLAEALLNV